MTDIPDDVVERVVEAMYEAWRKSPIAADWAKNRDWQWIRQMAANGHQAAIDFRDVGMSEARAAIAAMPPPPEREALTRGAAKCREFIDDPAWNPAMRMTAGAILRVLLGEDDNGK